VPSTTILEKDLATMYLGRRLAFQGATLEVLLLAPAFLASSIQSPYMATVTREIASIMYFDQKGSRIDIETK
jgi:hypothetical protein